MLPLFVGANRPRDFRKINSNPVGRGLALLACRLRQRFCSFHSQRCPPDTRAPPSNYSRIIGRAHKPRPYNQEHKILRKIHFFNRKNFCISLSQRVILLSPIITLVYSPQFSHKSNFSERIYLSSPSFVPFNSFQHFKQNSAIFITSAIIYQICIAIAMHIFNAVRYTL